MIGTSIRSIRHLYRVSDTSLKTILIKFRESAWEVCKVIKMPKESRFGETIFIFNNVTRHSNWDYSTVISSKEFQKSANIEDVSGNYGRIISISSNDFSALSCLFQEIILLPNTFEADYEKFLKENSKMVSTLISNFCLNTRDVRTKRFYIYTEGSKNFFQWAVTLYYKHGIGMSTIKNILSWNESYKQLSKNLSKGTITAYTSRDSIIPLLGELSELRKEKRINDSINSFNTAQKKMLKENELSDDIRQALWRLSRLSDVKRLNFIKKMSSVNDFAELTRQLKFVTSVHFSWSKESFLDFINNVEGIKYEKIFENDNIVLVKTLDYETIKQLGKTTNWCISKNKHYWNNYIESHHGQTTQYMVFDFSKLEDDKLSIIGFTTTHNRGITSAHNFINEDLMGNNQNDQVLLNSFISQFKENRNVYSILADDGIDITLVVEYDMPPYKWNKDSIMDYLYECVNPENVEVLKSKDGKIVLSVTDQNLRYFFGDTYQDNISSEYYSMQHIIFIDLNKSRYDINKIQFGIIEEGYGDEDYCNGVYNERSLNEGKNFDSMLIEFGLPYNTIRRTNNPIVRLRNAISSFNAPMMNEAIKECDSKVLKTIIRNEIGEDSFFDILNRSVEGYMSFDYLNLLYDNGMTLHEVIPLSYIADLINNFAHSMKSVSRATTAFANMEGITDEEIKAFYNFNIERREDAKYIGYYLVIKMIFEKEKFNNRECTEVFKRFLSYMGGHNKQIEVFEQIVNLIKDNLDYSQKCDAIINLSKYTVYFGSEGLKNFLYQKTKKYSVLKLCVDAFKEDFEKWRARQEKQKPKVTVSLEVPEIATVNINAGGINYHDIFADLNDLDHPF